MTTTLTHLLAHGPRGELDEHTVPPVHTVLEARVELHHANEQPSDEARGEELEHVLPVEVALSLHAGVLNGAEDGREHHETGRGPLRGQQRGHNVHIRVARHREDHLKRLQDRQQEAVEGDWELVTPPNKVCQVAVQNAALLDIRALHLLRHDTRKAPGKPLRLQHHLPCDIPIRFICSKEHDSTEIVEEVQTCLKPL